MSTGEVADAKLATTPRARKGDPQSARQSLRVRYYVNGLRPGQVGTCIAPITDIEPHTRPSLPLRRLPPRNGDPRRARTSLRVTPLHQRLAAACRSTQQRQAQRRGAYGPATSRPPVDTGGPRLKLGGLRRRLDRRRSVRPGGGGALPFARGSLRRRRAAARALRSPTRPTPSRCRRPSRAWLASLPRHPRRGLPVCQPPLRPARRSAAREPRASSPPGRPALAIVAQPIRGGGGNGLASWVSRSLVVCVGPGVRAAVRGPRPRASSPPPGPPHQTNTPRTLDRG